MGHSVPPMNEGRGFAEKGGFRALTRGRRRGVGVGVRREPRSSRALRYWDAREDGQAALWPWLRLGKRIKADQVICAINRGQLLSTRRGRGMLGGWRRRLQVKAEIQVSRLGQ